jgi:hypothetical protein
MIVDKYGNYVRKFMWQLPTQLPHKFSYIDAILIHNHFESPNITELKKLIIDQELSFKNRIRNLKI